MWAKNEIEKMINKPMPFPMLSDCNGNVGRNVSETIRQLAAFQLVRESQGTKATPAGWKPGKKVLRPGPDLVGNVWKE